MCVRIHHLTCVLVGLFSAGFACPSLACDVFVLVLDDGAIAFIALGDPEVDPVDEMWFFPQTPGVSVDFDDPCGFGIFSSGGPWDYAEVFETPDGIQMPEGGVRFSLEPGGTPFSDATYLSVPVTTASAKRRLKGKWLAYCHDPSLGYGDPQVVTPAYCDPVLPGPAGCADTSFLQTLADLDLDGSGIPDQCEPSVPTVSEWGLVAMTLLMLTAGTLVFKRRQPACA